MQQEAANPKERIPRVDVFGFLECLPVNASICSLRSINDAPTRQRKTNRRVRVGNHHVEDSGLFLLRERQGQRSCHACPVEYRRPGHLVARQGTCHRIIFNLHRKKPDRHVRWRGGCAGIEFESIAAGFSGRGKLDQDGMPSVGRSQGRRERIRAPLHTRGLGRRLRDPALIRRDQDGLDFVGRDQRHKAIAGLGRRIQRYGNLRRSRTARNVLIAGDFLRQQRSGQHHQGIQSTHTQEHRTPATIPIPRPLPFRKMI